MFSHIKTIGLILLFCPMAVRISSALLTCATSTTISMSWGLSSRPYWLSSTEPATAYSKLSNSYSAAHAFFLHCLDNLLLKLRCTLFIWTHL